METVFLCYECVEWEYKDVKRVVTSKAVAMQWVEEQTRTKTHDFYGPFFSYKEVPVQNCAFDLK